MAQNPMQLLLDKFIATNQVVYQDRPSAVQRLGEVTVDNMQVVTIDVDQNDETKRIAQLSSVSLMIDAIDQQWQCATLLGPVVLNYTVGDIIPSLTDVTNINAQGIYKYQDGADVKVAQIVLTNFTDYDGVLNSALSQLEEYTNYTITSDNVTLVETIDEGWVIKIVSDYISGQMVLTRFDESKIIKGNWALGYLGQVSGANLIKTGSLASLVGLGTTNTITPDSVWLKFSYYGSIVYIAKKTVVNEVSYNNLNTAGVIAGTRIVTIGSTRFYIRSPLGLGGLGSNEWEDLIYRVHVDDPTLTHWEVFTNEDMNIGLDGSGNPITGDQTITSDSGSVNGYYTRGATGLTSKDAISAGGVNNFIAWRPVLVLIGVKNIASLNIKNLELNKPVPVLVNTSNSIDAARKMFGITAKLIPEKVNTLSYQYNDLVNVMRIVTFTQLLGGSAAPTFASSTIQNALQKIIYAKANLTPSAVNAITYAIVDTVRTLVLLKATPGGSANPVIMLPTTFNMVATIKHINFKQVNIPDAPVVTSVTFSGVTNIGKPKAIVSPVPLGLLH